jgi:hypothetical protein
MSAVSDEKMVKEEPLTSETTIKDQIFAMVNVLPAEQLKEVLTFVEFLNHKVASLPQKQAKPKTSSESKRLEQFNSSDLETVQPQARTLRLKGSLAHLGPAPTEEDIAEARREMWAKFYD